MTEAAPSAEDEFFASLEEEEEPYGTADLILVLEALTEKQRFVVELRYGLKDGHEYSQRDVASIMGVTQQAVQRIEERAIGRMQGVVETPLYTEAHATPGTSFDQARSGAQ